MSITEKPLTQKRSWLSAPPPAPRLDEAEVKHLSLIHI